MSSRLTEFRKILQIALDDFFEGMTEEQTQALLGVISVEYPRLWVSSSTDLAELLVSLEDAQLLALVYELTTNIRISFSVADWDWAHVTEIVLDSISIENGLEYEEDSSIHNTLDELAITKEKAAEAFTDLPWIVSLYLLSYAMRARLLPQ